MSNKTVISVKVDKDVRDKARKVAKRLGIPLSMVVNQELKRFVAQERITIEEPLVPNAKTRKVLDKAIRELEAGDMRNFSPKFTNMKDANDWLDRKK